MGDNSWVIILIFQYVADVLKIGVTCLSLIILILKQLLKINLYTNFVDIYFCHFYVTRVTSIVKSYLNE